MINFSISKTQLKQLKQIQITLALAICLVFMVFVILWANQAEKFWRPLVDNIKVADAVKVTDALDAAKVEYFTQLEDRVIYVDAVDNDRARLALARIGLVAEYPDIELTGDSNEACNSLAASITAREAMMKVRAQDPNIPISEKPYFLKLVTLLMAGLVLIVLVVSVMRPLFKGLLADDKGE